MYACAHSLTQVSEVSSASQRGRAFGITQFALNTGQILSSLIATPLSEASLPGIVAHGWRLSFFMVGGLSLLLCVLLTWCMREPVSARGKAAGGVRVGVLRRVRDEGGKAGRYLGIPTFIVMVLQVCVCVYVCMCVRICWCVCVGMSAHACLETYMHACMHTYVNTYTHTHTHT